MSSETADKPVYTRNNPYTARITENFILNEGSDKETRHIVVNIEGSGITYVPGASLGVFPKNREDIVDELIGKLGFDPAQVVEHKKAGSVALRELFINFLTLNRVNPKFVKAVQEKVGDADLDAICEDKDKLNAYIHTRDYIDVLNDYPAASFTPEEFILLPTPANPRLYSIASSLDAHPGEVHLTVAVVKYNTHGRDKRGLASGYLGELGDQESPEVKVFITPAKHFHLPPTSDVDMVMVGPGTGIAPFRAFIEQRIHDNAPGKSWLFFGDRRQATDYLYGEELEKYKADGKLARIDLAFSRDQDHKIYVQDRMRENGKELWDWLERGAYFFVCGDKEYMAKDVHQALIDIAKEHGGKSDEEAVEYIEKTLMKEEKRYLRDVY